ncbi:MAG: sigma-70 family RNA polymerase sigma factor [Oligoflexales bacterium]|nr:sigma-70 family RNA polymerase sigma factor [Oligoflexales bacterium]
MENSNPPNGSLLTQIAAGNRNAFNMFYKKYVTKLRQFLRKKGLGHQEVEDDLIQEIFLKVWNKAKYFDENKGKEQSWLLALSQNCLYDYWRRIQSAPVFTEQESEELEIAEGHEEEQKLKHDWLTIQAALKHLSEVDLNLFKMVYIEGRTMEQCSQVLGIPNGTIKWRVSNIKKKIRQYAQ